MTQEKFNEQIEYAYKFSDAKAIVARTVRLCIMHPCLAMVWYERQPKATQDEKD